MVLRIQEEVVVVLVDMVDLNHVFLEYQEQEEVVLLLLLMK